MIHIVGSEETGGARAAALATYRPGDTLLPAWPMTPLQRALREIGGYCSPSLVRTLRAAYHGHESVQLHRFSEFGTAAIRAAVLEGIPVNWHCYDYWVFCPRSNFYGPDGRCDHACIRCYQPHGRRLPLFAKAFLAGRRRRILRHLNTLTSVRVLSNHSRWLLKRFGVTVPIRVERLTVDVPKLDVPKIPGRVLFVGWDRPNKGGHVFREATAMVKCDPVMLDTAAGRPREEVLREIAQAQVLVVPEQWENMSPVVILEAKALGTRVVASALGGIPEITNRKDFLCPPDSPRAFARAIGRVLKEERCTCDSRSA